MVVIEIKDDVLSNDSALKAEFCDGVSNNFLTTLFDGKNN